MDKSILKVFFGLNGSRNYRKINRGKLKYNNLDLDIGPIFVFNKSEMLTYNVFNEKWAKHQPGRRNWRGYFVCEASKSAEEDLKNFKRLLECNNPEFEIHLIFNKECREIYHCYFITSKVYSEFFGTMQLSNISKDSFFVRFKAYKKDMR